MVFLYSLDMIKRALSNTLFLMQQIQIEIIRGCMQCARTRSNLTLAHQSLPKYFPSFVIWQANLACNNIGWCFGKYSVMMAAFIVIA